MRLTNGKIKMNLRLSASFFLIQTLLIYETQTKSTEPKSSEEKLIAKEQQNNEFKNNLLQIENEVDKNRAYREKYARKMISFINQSVDPCDDFYEYACGNWKNSLIKRNTQRRRLALLEINFDLADKVEDLLQNPNDLLKEKYAAELKQARSFYASCLATNLQKLPKSEVYIEVIKNISGFPAIDDNWRSEDFDWLTASAQLSNYGVMALINEFIIPQYPFPPYFKLIELGFDEVIRNDSVSNKTSSGYQVNEQIMREYLSIYGVSEPKANDVVHSIFEFWQAVLNATASFTNKYECRAFGNSRNITKWKKFEEYFKVTWNNLDEFEQYMQLAWNGTESVYEFSACACPYFYAKLEEVCNERKAAVANYLALKFLHHMDARLQDKAFHKQFCNGKVKSALRFLIDQFYMAEYFDPKVNDEIASISKGIRSSLRQRLETLDWLDDETRKEALLKESTMELRVGRYENKKLMDKLIPEIQKLNFEEDNYEKNNVEMAKFEQYMKRYNGLHFKELENNTRPLQMLTGMQSQGFYYNIDNSINVMAGILHPPAYHEDWPWALKYGTLGFLIGHETTHAFDTAGAGFDSKGLERGWYTEKAEEMFQNETQCYINMFNEYEVPEIKRRIDGDTTRDENIADHGGLRHALYAYKNHMENLKHEDESAAENEYMPGLHLKPQQLFYLGFAQLWCADYQEKHYWQELKDPHTIDKYRVLGSVSNTEEFAQAFNCPVGSNMHPDRKSCKLW